jgi:hypothetical protein
MKQHVVFFKSLLALPLLCLGISCSSANAQIDPIDIDVDTLLNCGMCLRTGQPIKCDDIMNLPVAVCGPGASWGFVDGKSVLGCHFAGPFVWAADLDLGRTVSALPGQSGQECESYRGKLCTKSQTCKFVKILVGYDAEGNEVYTYHCQNSGQYVPATYQWDHYPSGDSCDIPIFDPPIGIDPFGTVDP